MTALHYAAYEDDPDAVRILMLTGAELHEPVFSHGPFVMNTIQEVQQAIFDYHDGKMGMLVE